MTVEALTSVVWFDSLGSDFLHSDSSLPQYKIVEDTVMNTQKLFSDLSTVQSSDLSHIFWEKIHEDLKKNEEIVYWLICESLTRFAIDEQIEHIFSNKYTVLERISELLKATFNIPILITPNVLVLTMYGPEMYALAVILWNYYQLAPDSSEVKNKHVKAVNDIKFIDFFLRNRCRAHRILRMWLQEKAEETFKKRKTVIKDLIFSTLLRVKEIDHTLSTQYLGFNDNSNHQVAKTQTKSTSTISLYSSSN